MEARAVTPARLKLSSPQPRSVLRVRTATASSRKARAAQEPRAARATPPLLRAQTGAPAGRPGTLTFPWTPLHRSQLMAIARAAYLCRRSVEQAGERVM